MATLKEVLKKLAYQRDAAEERRTTALASQATLQETTKRVLGEVVLPVAKRIVEGLGALKLAPELKEGGETHTEGKQLTRIVSIAFTRPAHADDRAVTGRKPDFFAVVMNGAMAVLALDLQAGAKMSYKLVKSAPIETLDTGSMESMFAEAMERIMAPLE